MVHGPAWPATVGTALSDDPLMLTRKSSSAHCVTLKFLHLCDSVAWNQALGCPADNSGIIFPCRNNISKFVLKIEKLLHLGVGEWQGFPFVPAHRLEFVISVSEDLELLGGWCWSLHCQGQRGAWARILSLLSRVGNGCHYLFTLPIRTWRRRTFCSTHMSLGSEFQRSPSEPQNNTSPEFQI